MDAVEELLMLWESSRLRSYMWQTKNWDRRVEFMQEFVVSLDCNFVTASCSFPVVCGIVTQMQIRPIESIFIPEKTTGHLNDKLYFFTTHISKTTIMSCKRTNNNKVYEPFCCVILTATCWNAYRIISYVWMIP